MDARVLALSFIYLANITTNLGVAFFLPQIIKGMGATDVEANTISAIPFVFGILAWWCSAGWPTGCRRTGVSWWPSHW